MIRARRIKDRRATYTYEVAWVFDQKEDGSTKILKKSEEDGNMERAALGRGKKAPVKPLELPTLRKPKQITPTPSRTTKKTV